MVKQFKWCNGQWQLMCAGFSFCVHITDSFVSVFGVTDGLFLMGSFSTGGNILGSKCRFHSLTFLSDSQTKFICAGQEHLSIDGWSFEKEWFPSPLPKGYWPKKRIFSIAPLDCFSQFGENYTLRALLKIFLFYSWSDIWEQLSILSYAINFLDQCLKSTWFQAVPSESSNPCNFCLLGKWRNIFC